MIVRVLVLCLVAALPAQADEGSSPVADDLTLAGEQVELRQPQAGSAILVGGTVRMGAAVAEDALLSGGEVSVEDRVGADVYAAAGRLRISAPIAGNARLAAGKVVLARGASVGGRALIAGGEVELSGPVGHSARVVADTVRLDGEIGGDLHVWARRLVVGPAAQVAGRLVYASPTPADISPSAVIGGGVEYRRTEEPRRWLAPALQLLTWAVAGVALSGMLLLGVVAILLFPRASGQTARVILSEPGKSLALGFALLVSVPVGAALLLTTVVGIPLGLALLLSYPLLLLGGCLMAGLCLGDALARWFARKRGEPPGPALRALGLAVGLLAMMLAGGLPYVGWLMLLAAVVAGAGAAGLRVYRAYAGQAQSAA